MNEAREFPDGEQALVKADPTGRYLAKLDQATRMLAEAKTIDEVAAIVNLTEGVKALVRTAKLGLEAHNHGAEINLRAQRRTGEMLAQLDKGQGGRPPKTADKVSEVSEYRRTIDEAQVPPKTATRWQQVAEVPADRFEQYINHQKEVSEELSTAGLLRDATAQKPASPAKPRDKYHDQAKVNEAMDALEQAIAQFLEKWPDGLSTYWPERRLLEIVGRLEHTRAAAARDAESTQEPAQGGEVIEVSATIIKPTPLTTMPIEQSLELPDDGGDYEHEPETVSALA